MNVRRIMAAIPPSAPADERAMIESRLLELEASKERLRFTIAASIGAMGERLRAERDADAATERRPMTTTVLIVAMCEDYYEPHQHIAVVSSRDEAVARAREYFADQRYGGPDRHIAVDEWELGGKKVREFEIAPDGTISRIVEYSK